MSSVDRKRPLAALGTPLSVALIAAALTAMVWGHEVATPTKPHAMNAALTRALPENLRARYWPIEAPADLGLSAPSPPPDLLRRWNLDSAGYKGPLAWCPATDKLAFFSDGWIWITDAKGSRLHTLWPEPELAAAGRLAWSADGGVLWIRADRWRRWISLRLEIERH